MIKYSAYSLFLQLLLTLDNDYITASGDYE